MPLASSCIVCGERLPAGGSRCPRHDGRRHDLPRSCINCGAATLAGDYCDRCEAVAEAARQQRREASGARDHYKGDYQTRRKAVLRRAYAGRELCWLAAIGECTQPVAGHIPGVKWSADHVIAGDPTSEIRAAHLPCNVARGNRAR